MKSQLNNALAFFLVVAIITNLSTFATAKIRQFRDMQEEKFYIFFQQVFIDAVFMGSCSRLVAVL